MIKIYADSWLKATERNWQSYTVGCHHDIRHLHSFTITGKRQGVVTKFEVLISENLGMGRHPSLVKVGDHAHNHNHVFGQILSI